MKKETKESIITDYMQGDWSYIDAIEELIKLGLTALEAEQIIFDLEPIEDEDDDSKE